MRLPKNPVLIVFAIVFIIIVLSALDLFLPVLLGVIGYWLYQNRSQLAGIVLMVTGAILLVKRAFDIDLAGIVVAALFVYLGYRLIKSQEREPKRARSWNCRHDQDEEHERSEEHKRKASEEAEREDRARSNDWRYGWSIPSFGGSLVGNLRLINHQFDLEGLNISYGACDVKIDLSKAIIPEGETTLVISALVGDVDIYVPYDLDVAVTASVTAGNVEVLGTKQGGLNCHLQKTSPSYSGASRKVKISISMLLGDVDVRYL